MKITKFIPVLSTLLATLHSNLVTALPSPASPPLRARQAPLGEWKIVGNSGVAAMHIAVVSHKEIIIIDKVEANPIKQANGNPAISALYNIETNEYRILNLQTDTFCTAGAWFSNGTLIHAGGAEKLLGYDPGFQSIRFYTPGENADWVDIPNGMNTARWYPAMATLPSGDVLILGGSTKGTGVNTAALNNPTYEIWSENNGPGKTINLDFLANTLPYNLYAFVHVLPNDEKKQIAFIFASTQSIVYDFDTATVVKKLPQMPGSIRSYPLTGTSVMLPLRPSKNYKPVIMICGGGNEMEIEAPAEASCGRIDPTEKNPAWETDNFGGVGRMMPDVVILADAKLLFLNGAGEGFAGYHRGPKTNPLYVANKPVLAPSLYDPETKKWSQLAPSEIPRLYHSVATLVSDGRVFVTGSNPQGNVDTKSKFPTEYRVEMFTPPYLLTGLARPKIISVAGSTKLNTERISVTYGQKVEVLVTTNQKVPFITAAVVHPGFITHSNNFSQRYVLCEISSAYYSGSKNDIVLTVEMPPNPTILPPGPSYLYILDNDVPAEFAVELLLN